MTISQISKRESPLWQVIEYLQRNGSATIKELEDLLGVTTTAVRQHLTTLQVEGYIERRVVHSGVGRPHHAYFTTPKVQELFACQCDDLALTLLQEVFHLEGQERALQLLDRVGHRSPGAPVLVIDLDTVMRDQRRHRRSPHLLEEKPIARRAVAFNYAFD